MCWATDRQGLRPQPPRSPHFPCHPVHLVHLVQLVVYRPLDIRIQLQIGKIIPHYKTALTLMKPALELRWVTHFQNRQLQYYTNLMTLTLPFAASARPAPAPCRLRLQARLCWIPLRLTLISWRIQCYVYATMSQCMQYPQIEKQLTR